MVGLRRGTAHAIFKDLSLVGAGHHSHLQRTACDAEQHGAPPCKISGEAIGLCSLSFLPQLQVLKTPFLASASCSQSFERKPRRDKVPASISNLTF